MFPITTVRLSTDHMSLPRFRLNYVLQYVFVQFHPNLRIASEQCVLLAHTQNEFQLHDNVSNLLKSKLKYTEEEEHRNKEAIR